MKAKKLFLTTAALTLLISSTAFAGTWQTGSGENQGKWWYDNGDGTYAQNGWQWIDDNGDGVSECYYFDANGWMYADTTTPDGYQVNSSGAWVENGVVKTLSAAPVQNWFDSAGLQANALQNIPYDYVSNTYTPATFKTTGKLSFYGYRSAETDYIHPAQEGYEWKTIYFSLEFTDANTMAYGASWAYAFGNRDFIELINDWDGSEHVFTLNFNGKEYSNCKMFANTETFSEEDGVYFGGSFTCCVPKGYTGMFLAFYDSELYPQIAAYGEAGYINALRNAVIFPLN